ncbi:uncharacterized protein LAJ45_03340 [Morchella importuna]|uniref:uncharacterized protein n=1 Tax=Morchella importuna TaxID=1174673 RepID=UPI001E8CC9D0|nr:uncharacterized protein LAJ45_03340 [Morchella importuna]KAH8152500.1 hypothetical protein LAJ45_03340 [Morchella importuna]
MLFDTAKPAEDQFDENVRIINQVKIINQEDGPRAALEVTPGAVSRVVPREAAPLLIPQSPVLVPSVLSPIIGRWKSEDKAKAELEEKTAAAAEKTASAAEAKRLKKQRKNKARKEKKNLKKQSVSESQSSGEDTRNEENQLVLYEEILSDDELNLNSALPNRYKNDDESLLSCAELKILYKYLASIEGDATFIRNTRFAIERFTKMIRRGELKCSEIVRNEEIKAHAVETKPSLRLGSTIEWKSPKGVMKGVKKCLPIDSKVSSASVEKEYQMGELKKAVSPTLKFEILTKDDKTSEMISQAPVKTSQFTVESIEKPDYKNTQQEKFKEIETSQASPKPSTEAVAPVSGEEIKETPKITAPTPVVNDVKEVWGLEKLFPPVVPSETKVVKTRAVATPRIPETRADKIKAWLAENGQPESTKVTESTVPLLIPDGAEESQVDETVSTDTTQVINQGPTKAGIQSVETVVVPAFVVSETKEFEELEILPPKVLESESIPELNELEASGIESPTLVDELSTAPIKLEGASSAEVMIPSTVGSPTPADEPLTALIELEVVSSTEGTIPSIVGHDQLKKQDEVYFGECDYLVQELEELLSQSAPEPNLQPEDSSQVQEEPQIPEEVSPTGPEVPQITITSAIQGALEPQKIQECTEIIAPAVELTADEAVPIGKMMRINIELGGNIIEDMDTQGPLESSSSQALGIAKLLTAHDWQTGGDDILEFLKNFDDSSLGVVSYNDLEPTAAPNEVLELSNDMEETTRPFDADFDLNYRCDENIDIEAIFNEILDQGELLSEDQMNVCQLANMDANGQTDVADHIMTEVMSSEHIPTVDGVEIDQLEFSENDLFRQEILAASIDESLLNQTQMVPEATVAIPANNEFEGQQNGADNEFQFEMPQEKFIPQLDTSLTASRSIEQFTPVSPESSILVSQLTTEQVSYQETIHPELSIENAALLLLRPTQEAFAPQSYTEKSPMAISQEVFNSQLVTEQQSTPVELAQPVDLAQQTFVPQVEIGRTSQKPTEKNISEPSTSVELFQGTIIPYLPVDQPISLATTQEPSRQITIKQSVSEFDIEQSPPAAPLEDTTQSTQEHQISQAVIPHPIFSTANLSSTTIDGTELDIPQKSLDSVINTFPFIFALQVTEKTSNKRCVEPDDDNDDEDEDENIQANMEVMMLTKRPVIPLRKKVLETTMVKVAPAVDMPMKPKGTTGIRMIMTAPTQSDKEISLKKVSSANSTSTDNPCQQRTKIEVAPETEELKAEPNYDSAKVNMQQQLNKTTTKLQAITMEKSVASARQRGMEIDDKGFFQLGLEKNKPRRRY